MPIYRRKKQVQPQEVEIELMYDDDYGFSAESYVHDRKQVHITLNIIEGRAIGWIRK